MTIDQRLIEQLASRYSDLFGHRSLASAIFDSAEKMAEAVLGHQTTVASDGGDNDFDDGDEDGGWDEPTYLPCLADAETPTAETVYATTGAVVSAAISGKLSAVQGDPRYQDVGRAFLTDLTTALSNTDTKDAFVREFERSAGWDGFVTYMKEKMPMNGFGEMMRSHLDALAIQAVASREASGKLTNRRANVSSIAMATMQHLSNLTMDGMVQEAKELGVQMGQIFIGLRAN